MRSPRFPDHGKFNTAVAISWKNGVTIAQRSLFFKEKGFYEGREPTRKSEPMDCNSGGTDSINKGSLPGAGTSKRMI